MNIERPRDRKEINNNPEYRRLRNEVIDYQLDECSNKRDSLEKSLTLPDIEPTYPTLLAPSLRNEPPNDKSKRITKILK